MVTASLKPSSIAGQKVPASVNFQLVALNRAARSP
jgi:hypothetical protein